MWKYVVTWVVIKTMLIACPQLPQEVDEFGRVSPVQAQTSQLCFTTDTTYHEKIFDSIHIAKSFIEKGKRQKDLHNFNLDSIPQKRYNELYILKLKH